MIQFNLLPDVKLEYIKTKRTKRTATVLSVIVAASALTICLLLFVIVGVVQKKYLHDLSADIKTSSKKLQDIKDLDKILTVQNQLNSLPALHDKKPVSSRLFVIIQQVTPVKVSIASLDLDFANQTLSITGSADSISTVNKFVDTLKFTNYRSDDDQKLAFSDVVLTSFGRDDKGASYQIDFKFDPIIFDNANNLSLVVPQIVTTRSEIEKPDSLFQPLSNNGQ